MVGSAPDPTKKIEKENEKMATQVSPENVETTIYDGLVELGTERDQLSREASLEDLDVDSLDLVELAQIVEDEYGVELKGDDVKDVKTVGEVIDLVVAKAS
jgi:acyl carrier protein